MGPDTSLRGAPLSATTRSALCVSRAAVADAFAAGPDASPGRPATGVQPLGGADGGGHEARSRATARQPFSKYHARGIAAGVAAHPGAGPPARGLPRATRPGQAAGLAGAGRICGMASTPGRHDAAPAASTALSSIAWAPARGLHGTASPHDAATAASGRGACHAFGTDDAGSTRRKTTCPGRCPEAWAFHAVPATGKDAGPSCLSSISGHGGHAFANARRSSS